MKNLNYYSALVLGCFFFVATSCSNYKSEVVPKSSLNSEIVADATIDYNSSEENLGTKMALENTQKSVANVSFTTSPSVNTWTAGSSGNLNLSCANFQAGLKASILRIENGNKITVRIQRTDGKTFGSAGTGYVKAVNPCGSIAGNTSWTNTSFYYIDIDFWATFTTGSVYFYPTIGLTNGQRFYANPVLVTAKQDNSYFKQLVSDGNYNHFCQLNSVNNPGMACIPTSYMIAKKIVYPNSIFTSTELNRISNGMGLTGSGTSITAAQNFAKSDIGSCNASVYVNSDVLSTTNYIVSSLNAGRPLIGVTNLATRHIVTVVGLKLSSNNQNSLIYYIDPLSKVAGVKEMSLLNFLSSMRSASDYGNHNFLKIGC
jgi:hypothetical protein